MKRSVPRLILYVLLLIKAFAVVIPDYDNIPLLITALVIMVGLAIAVFRDSRASMAKYMLWYAAAGIMLFFALPGGLPRSVNIERILGELIDAVLFGVENPVFLFSFAALVVFQLFFRKLDNSVFMVLRYGAAALFLIAFSQELFGSNWYYSDLILLVCVLCLTYELNSALSGAHCRRMLGCILFCLFCMLVQLVFGYKVFSQITAFITFGDEGWLYTVLAVLVVGLLLILENWNLSPESQADLPADSELGEALVCWSLLGVSMQMWDVIMNTAVLFLVFPFVFHVYCVFLHAYRVRTDSSGKGIFIKSWIFILLGLVAFSKCLNYAHFSAGTMVVLFVAGYLAWNVSGRVSNNPNAMNGFLGVAAIVLMASLAFDSIDQVQDNVSAVVSMLVASFMWIHVCSEAGKVNAKASDAYQAEFRRIFPMQRIGAMVALVIAAVRAILM